MKETTKSPGHRILIAYFSRTGNTREMAQQIQKTTGGDLFEIVPLKPYPSAYGACVDQAKEEINAGYKPELKSKVDDISQYDIVFIGSPNWWSTVAPPVATFLSSYDLSGKTAIPFMTHGGGGSGHMVNDIKEFCLDSSVLDGLAINGSWVSGSQDEVNKWLRQIGIIK